MSSNQKREYRESIFNKPFDAIDRLFQTERASMRGVAFMVAAIGVLLYWREGPKEITAITIIGTCALFAFVASFLNETAREVLFFLVLTIGALRVVYGNFFFQ